MFINNHCTNLIILLLFIMASSTSDAFSVIDSHLHVWATADESSSDFQNNKKRTRINRTDVWPWIYHTIDNVCGTRSNFGFDCFRVGTHKTKGSISKLSSSSSSLSNLFLTSPASLLRKNIFVVFSS